MAWKLIITNISINFSACTAERFFRIDKAQEQLHYVTDVAVETVYVLEENANQSNDSEEAKISMTQKSETGVPSRYFFLFIELNFFFSFTIDYSLYYYSRR